MMKLLVLLLCLLFIDVDLGFSAAYVDTPDTGYSISIASSDNQGQAGTVHNQVF